MIAGVSEISNSLGTTTTISTITTPDVSEEMFNLKLADPITLVPVNDGYFTGGLLSNNLSDLDSKTKGMARLGMVFDFSRPRSCHCEVYKAVTESK